MKQKQHSTEEIIRILRQAETDKTIDSVCRKHNVSKATFHRWKRKYGDMDIADAKRLKELKKEILAGSMLKNRVNANEERYGAAIEALDAAGKTGSAEALAAARWKRT